MWNIICRILKTKHFDLTKNINILYGTNTMFLNYNVIRSNGVGVYFPFCQPGVVKLNQNREGPIRRIVRVR